MEPISCTYEATFAKLFTSETPYNTWMKQPLGVSVTVFPALFYTSSRASLSLYIPPARKRYPVRPFVYLYHDKCHRPPF